SQAPEGGLARYSLEQRPAPGLRPPHAPGPSHATWRGQTSMTAPTPMDGLGFSIRQYRAGTHQAGKGPRGHQRLGFNPLITPAKANAETHLAELGRISRRGRAGPQAALIRHLNPKLRGGAHDDRTWVRQATFSRVAHLPRVQLRHWAGRRHPTASAGGVDDQYWPRRDSRCSTLQALHGHGHDAKTREQGEDLSVGRRDQHQDTEERSARQRARSVL